MTVLLNFEPQPICILKNYVFSSYRTSQESSGNIEILLLGMILIYDCNYIIKINCYCVWRQTRPTTSRKLVFTPDMSSSILG